MSQIISQLKNDGNRLTGHRSEIIGVLESANEPISAIQLIKLVKANKTTIYRELDFLIFKGFVSEYDFADGKKYYELSSKGHHHHLVCTDCKKVECYEVKTDLSKEELNIASTRKFQVTSHALDFFGKCANCK